MSKKNRKAMYIKLVRNDKLYQDDGALVAEFGQPSSKKKEVKKIGK